MREKCRTVANHCCFAAIAIANADVKLPLINSAIHGSTVYTTHSIFQSRQFYEIRSRTSYYPYDASQCTLSSPPQHRTFLTSTHFTSPPSTLFLSLSLPIISSSTTLFHPCRFLSVSSIITYFEGDNSLSDSDFVMSIFMNYCDFQDRGSDSNHK